MVASPSGAVRIVLIDDNEQSCTLLRRFFSLENVIQVVGMAGSGLMGLELVRQLQPDLVLTDYNLPDVDGETITNTIRREMPHIPVIIMSAECETWVADIATQAGASAFVLKNGSPELIVRAIYEAVDASLKP